MHMICMEAVIRMLLKKDVKGTVCNCFDLLWLNKTMHFVAEHYFGCASALILLYCASALI